MSDAKLRQDAEEKMQRLAKSLEAMHLQLRELEIKLGMEIPIGAAPPLDTFPTVTAADLS